MNRIWIYKMAFLFLLPVHILFAENSKAPRKRICGIGPVAWPDLDCDGIYLWGPGIGIAAANGGFNLGVSVGFGYAHNGPMNSWWYNMILEKQDNLFYGAELGYKLFGLEVAYHLLKPENFQGISIKPFAFFGYGFIYYRFNYFPQLTYHEFGFLYKFPQSIYLTKPEVEEQ